MKASIKVQSCLIFLSLFMIRSASGNPGLENRTHDAFNRSLQYYFYIPENYDPQSAYPLVIVLGDVTYESAQESVWLSDIVQTPHPCFVLFPRRIELHSWYAQLDLLSHLLYTLLQDYAIDKTRFYVMGVSKHGNGSWDAAIYSPFHIAAVMPSMASAESSSVPLLDYLPACWVFHGANDPQISVEYARAMIAAYEDMGLEVVYTDCKYGEPTGMTEEELDSLIDNGAEYIYSELEGRGHDLTNAEFENPRVIRWLFMQKTEDYTYIMPEQPAREISPLPDFLHVTQSEILTPGEPGSWDGGNLNSLAVIKDGDTLKMWYTAYETPWQEPVKLGYAWSLDGKTWQKYSHNPVFESMLGWEGESILDFAIIKDADTYKMWYGANMRVNWPGIIGYATSNDGIHWDRHAEPVLEAGNETDWDYNNIGPSTVLKEGDTYKMYYFGGNWFENYQIGLATSADGIHWEKYDDPSTTEPPYHNSDPVLKVGTLGNDWEFDRVWYPCVLPLKEGYEMYYIGSNISQNNLCHAVSEGGIVWYKNAYNPILKLPPEWFNPVGLMSPMLDWPNYFSGSLIEIDHLMHYWYTIGFSKLNIGYAVSYGKIARCDSVRCDVQYCAPGNDSLLFRAWIQNPYQHNLQVIALLEDQTQTIVDSVALVDDGNHGDDDPGDNVWGIYHSIGNIERTYTVRIKTVDLDSSIIHVCEAPNSIYHFSTVGPLEVIDFIKGDYSARYRTQYFKLSLKNYGHSAVAKNVSVHLKISDEDTVYIEKINAASASFGDVPPGEVRECLEPMSFNYKSEWADKRDSIWINFDYEIATEGWVFWSGTPVEEEQNVSRIPVQFNLYQNYPNPFNPKTLIRYALPVTSQIDLSIYNTLGQKVAVLVSEKQPAGTYTVEWDASGFASGIYLYRISSDLGSTETRKLILIK